MIELSHYTPQTFLPAIERMIADPRAFLEARAEHLIALIPDKQTNAYLDKALTLQRPTLADYLPEAGAALLNPPSAMALAAGKHIFSQFRHGALRKKVTRLLFDLRIKRPQRSLDPADQQLIRQMSILLVQGALTSRQWYDFILQMTYGDGDHIVISPPERDPANPHFPETRKLLADLLKLALPDYKAFRAEAVSTIARLSKDPAAIHVGPRWATVDDTPTLPTLSFNTAPKALILGDDAATGKSFAFTGNESLITIGPPGSGKTESQVIPNLLTYPGSVIVLDVKGELWEKTAGARQRFGRVLRFAPTDPHGNTNRYNPLDFISQDPHLAALDAAAIATDILPKNPEAREPFWADRGRDYVRAMLLLVALTASPPKRHLGNVLRCLSIQTATKATAAEFKGSFTETVINTMRDIAHKQNLPALKSIPDDILSGLGSVTLTSVLEHSRQALAIFNSSPRIINATSQSDWEPQILRDQPGTSLYICFSGSELESYSPLVRILLSHHANVLLTNFTNLNTGLPVTFFLDEFPQLGPFNAIRRMLETGRGAGLRLWLFSQTLSQIEAAYGRNIGAAIPNMCAIQCFMRCDPDAAKYLQPYLGQTRNILTGKEEDLAPVHELTTGRYADKIVSITRKPYLLEKRMAYKTMSHLYQRPPTVSVPPSKGPSTMTGKRQP